MTPVGGLQDVLTGQGEVIGAPWGISSAQGAQTNRINR